MTSTAATSTRKRKADEISDDTIDVPHLPAPVWGGILDFMPYGEVRSALLVGKHIAVEAVKYVKSINVLKPKEMHVPAARRFPNIEEVRILCLMQDSEEVDEVLGEMYTLSLETAYATAPFLASFPKLKEAFIGGRLKLGNETFDEEYDSDHCSSPNNHEEIFRGLVMSLGGAFKTGILSHDVAIKGVDNYRWNLFARPCSNESRTKNGTDSCAWCRAYCEQFPLTHIIPKGGSPTIFHCLTTREFWAIINGRPGGKEATQRANEEMLCRMLRHFIVGYHGWPNFFGEIPPDVEQRMQNENPKKLRLWVLSENALSEIDVMIEAGLNPRRIRREYLQSELSNRVHSGTKDRLCNAWAQSAVTELSSRGFPVDSIISLTGGGWE